MSTIPMIINATVFFNTTANMTAFLFPIGYNQKTVHWAKDQEPLYNIKSNITYFAELYRKTVTTTAATPTTTTIATTIHHFLFNLIKYSYIISTILLLLLLLFVFIGTIIFLCCHAIRLRNSHNIHRTHNNSLANMKNSSSTLEVHIPINDNYCKDKAIDV